MDRAGRQAEVDLLGKTLKKAQVALCADYRGLTVSQITKLRRDLRNAGSRGRVVKNTLARLAVEKVGKDDELQKFMKLFHGPSLLVYSETDPVAPVKVLSKFVKDNEKLKIKGGYFEGQFLDIAAVEAVSKMPSREEIFGKLLCLLNAPATQLLRLMKAPAEQLTRVIEAHRSNLEKKGGG